MDGDKLKWTIDYYEENTGECDEILKGLENFDKITLVTKDNFHLFKDGDLVRYQGMVQDVLKSEYYCDSCYFRNTKTGICTLKSIKYRDTGYCQADEEVYFTGSATEERSVYFVIPIPGTSSWVKDYLQKSVKAENSESKSCSKRPLEESDDEDMEVAEDNVTPDKGTKTKKTLVHTSDVQASGNVRHSVDKFFPLPEENGLPSIVRIYEPECSNEESQLIVNNRIEVIGFLSLNPVLENTADDAEPEEVASNPPPSLVPRIHALRHRKMTHNNPLFNETVHKSEIITNADKIRNVLHNALTQFLYGDTLAADYMICYLLSRVYSRAGYQGLGKLSLNLYNIKMDNYARRLYDILETLVTNSQYMPLTVQFLNETSLIPQKDYVIDRLCSGRLQLADDTYLILDETQMNEGKLENAGCLNVNALQSIIWDQQISYNFVYYPVHILTNLAVLVLSEGKSMLQTDIQLKLQTDPSVTATLDETFKGVSNFLIEENCDEIRKYLTCMRLQKFEISEELTLKIGEDYVDMRQRGTGIGPNDLQNLLVLSRLLALSHGRNSLALEDWARALEMENERKARSL